MFCKRTVKHSKENKESRVSFMYHINNTETANIDNRRHHAFLAAMITVLAMTMVMVFSFSSVSAFAASDSDSVSKVVTNNGNKTTTYYVKTSRSASEIKDGISDYLEDKDDSIQSVSFDDQDEITVTPLSDNQRAANENTSSQSTLSFKSFCKKVVNDNALDITTVSNDKEVVSTIPYDTIQKTSSEMRKTTKKVTGGVKGKVYKNYKVTRKNGEVTDKTYVSTTTKDPVDKVVTTGTGSVNAVGRTFSGTTGKKIVDYAKQFVGNPYVYGGTSLTNGCDCSGFIYSVYRHFGLNVPRIPYTAGKSVSLSNLQPGDIIIYSGHFAMYAGNGQVVHAINYQYGIRVTSMYFAKTPRAARRVVTDAE